MSSKTHLFQPIISKKQGDPPGGAILNTLQLGMLAPLFLSHLNTFYESINVTIQEQINAKTANKQKCI